MDGLRTFKRKTRLSFIGGKSARRYLRTNCNNCCLLIEPAGDRSVSLKAIPARGTSHSVLVASGAGNFALRARCKSRGELRTPCSLQIPHCSESFRKSRVEKRLSRFSFIRAEAFIPHPLGCNKRYESRLQFLMRTHSTTFTARCVIGDAKKSSALLGFFRSCIFPFLTLSYTYISKPM